MSTDVRPTAATAEADGRLLSFLAPGLAHALGNHLFVLRGTTSVMLRNGVAARVRETLDAALDEATQVLGILRVLAEPHGEHGKEQAGVLLSRLCRLARVPMRDRALDLELAHSSLDSPRTVEVARFVRAVGEMLRCAVDGLPSFVSGTLHVDLADQAPKHVAVTLRVEPGERMLPFSLELEKIVRCADGVVSAVGGRLEVGAREVLTLRVPTA